MPDPSRDSTQPSSKPSHVVLTLLAALALIVVLSVLVIWAGLVFIGRTVRVNVSQKDGRQAQVSIKTPVGGIEVNRSAAVTEAALGLPLYPGATQVKDEGSASVTIGLPEAARVRVVAAKYETPDPVDKVAAFYKERLGDEVTRFVARDAHGKTVFEIKGHKRERVVALSDNGAGTRIELVHVGAGPEQAN